LNKFFVRGKGKYRAKAENESFGLETTGFRVAERHYYEFLDNPAAVSSWDGITVWRDELPLRGDQRSVTERETALEDEKRGARRRP
jgi:hypothetical protein